MDFKDQSTFVECVYCKYVRPELQGSSECPFCQGKSREFRPARMMDEYTSGQHILDKMIRESERLNSSDLTKSEKMDILLSILEEIDLYGFDCKKAVIDKIQILDEKDI